MTEPRNKVDDLIFRERVFIARQMSPDEKILCGLQLFSLRHHYLAEELRAEYPNIDERLVQFLVAKMLARERYADPRKASLIP